MPIATLCRDDQVHEGMIHGHRLPDGTRIAVMRLHGRIYATDDTCTHENASLSEDGMLDEGFLVCSWHDGRFDPATGEACTAPCSQPLRTYPVAIVDGCVQLEY